MRNYKPYSRRYGYGRYPRKVAFGTAQRKQGGGNEIGCLWMFSPWILLALIFIICAPK